MRSEDAMATKKSWFGAATTIALGVCLAGCDQADDEVSASAAQATAEVAADTQFFRELSADEMSARSRAMSERFGHGWFAWPTSVGLLERVEYNLLPGPHVPTTREEQERLARRFLADNADLLDLTQSQIDRLVARFDAHGNVLLAGVDRLEPYAGLRVADSYDLLDSFPLERETMDRVHQYRFSLKDTAKVLWFANESKRYYGEPKLTARPVHGFHDQAVISSAIAAATQITVCHQIAGDAPPWALPPVTVVDLGKITEDEVRAATVEPFILRSSEPNGKRFTLAYGAKIEHGPVTWKVAFDTSDGRVLWRGDTYCAQ
jgi:hypothetical protein